MKHVRWLAIGALAVAIAVALTRCDARGSAETRSWPAGTVLAVDDVPITAEEVDRESRWVQPIEPAVSAPQLRRLALTNVVLPRLLSRLMAPEAHEKASKEAAAALAALRAGGAIGPAHPDGGATARVTGGWQTLGIVAWGAALELEDGAWSEVIEDCGRFIVLRRVRQLDAPMPIAVEVEVELYEFPWLAPDGLREKVDAEHDAHRLTIVAPEWKAIVPELIQYRMGVHSR